MEAESEVGAVRAVGSSSSSSSSSGRGTTTASQSDPTTTTTTTTKATKKGPGKVNIYRLKGLNASAPSPPLTAIDRPLEDYKVPELKALLAERRLPVSGKKGELVERLGDWLEDQEAEDEDGEDDEEDEGEDGCHVANADALASGTGTGTVGSASATSVLGGARDFSIFVDEGGPPAPVPVAPKKRMVVVGKAGRGNTFGMALSLQPRGPKDVDEDFDV
jgi:hypothetical protein